MARLLVARRGDPVRVEGVSDPADPERDVYDPGALLPGPYATLAGPAFEEWLDSTAENLLTATTRQVAGSVENRSPVTK